MCHHQVTHSTSNSAAKLLPRTPVYAYSGIHLSGFALSSLWDTTVIVHISKNSLTRLIILSDTDNLIGPYGGTAYKDCLYSESHKDL